MSDHDEMARAFDFEIGSWHVSHRRLRERLAGCQEWDSFTGTADMRPVLGGNGNIEDNFLNLPQGAYRAIAIRSYDPRRGLWAIWWLSTADPLSIETPVMGRFEGEVGTFYADDCFKGRPVKTRFLWLDTHTASPRWEQAMSADGGESWETNWTMDFKRAEAGAGAGEFVVASGTGAA